jgi:hypothetical protein
LLSLRSISGLRQLDLYDARPAGGPMQSAKDADIFIADNGGMPLEELILL